MKKFSQFFYSIFFKFQHFINYISLVMVLILTDILITIGDFSVFFLVPELAPTIFTFIIIIYICKKLFKSENPKFKAIIQLANSFIFWNFTFMWINPFPDIKRYTKI